MVLVKIIYEWLGFYKTGKRPNSLMTNGKRLMPDFEITLYTLILTFEF